MNRQTKERWVGFLLLLAIAAIFLPMLLDGDGLRQGRLQAVIPPAPPMPEMQSFEPQYQPHADSQTLAQPRSAEPLPLPAPPKPLSAAKPAAQAGLEAEQKLAKRAETALATPSKMATDKPVLDQQGVPTSWTLQLASFKDQANAKALQQRLIKRGYNAYLRSKGELTKVFVGPDLQRSVIEQRKTELKREMKLDGLVLRFKP
jgi:DedD protein